MSLVVAQVTDDGPRVVSDTRVIFRDGRRPRIKTGVLKSIVVSPELLVSFAGDVNIGLSAVREFAKCSRAGEAVESGVRELLSSAMRSAGAVDFIVASAAPSSRLMRIRASGIERGLSTAWIGDHAAFECFQSERHRLDHRFESLWASLSSSERVALLLGEAMRAVIDDPTLESVGDFCVSTIATGGAFNYAPSAFTHVGRGYRIEDGQIRLADVRPVEEGGYAFSVVVPVRPGTPAIGVSFPAARLGMLYLPLQCDEAQVLEAVSAREIATTCRERYGVEMATPMLGGPP